MTDATMILVAGALLGAGIVAALAARRLKVPGLVISLALGMLIGSDGLGWIHFDDVDVASTIGVIALALIIFEGGLAAGWGEIRPVIGVSISLATLGTVLTAIVVGFAAHWLLDLTLLEGMLLGSIVSATDSAAIFSVLRGSSLNRRLARVLEGESGFNDPVAIVLVIGFIDWIQDPGYGLTDMLELVVVELGVGALVGLAVGRAATVAFQKVRFTTTGLYPVASIAAAAIAFGGASELHGSGFLAVYIAGLSLGSAAIPARRTVDDFHDGLASVGQIAIFFTFGLLIFPSELPDVAGEGLLIAAVLMFVARPAATFVATAFAKVNTREALLLGWAGLRGAVPFVLATFAVIDDAPEAAYLFNIVFFVVLISTLLQGATFEPLARALRLTGDVPALGRQLIEVGTVRRLGAEVLEYPVGEDDAIVGRLVNELGLSRQALVNVIVREDQALLPRGSTAIKAGDRLHILMRAAKREQTEALFDRWRAGPIGEPEPPPVRLSARAAIFTVRRWRPDEDGDPGDPKTVGGAPVIRRLRTRRGEPGALVLLDDGRFAATSADIAAVGGSRQMLRYTRERIAAEPDDVSRAWWQEVAGVVAGARRPKRS